MGTDKTSYVKQQKLSFTQFFTELPNFLTLTVSAILTGSLIVWMDFIDSLGIVLRTGTVSALAKHLSKDLSYEYNYGVSQIENIAVLFCDGIVMCSLLIATALSVYGIIHPEAPSDLLIYVAVLKIINVTLDTVFLKEQHKIRNVNKSALTQSNYTAAVGALMFDVVGLCSILLVWIFKNSVWTWYFSPIISILIAGYLIYRCVSRVGKAVAELTGKTLPEEEQLKILRVMTRHYYEFSEFHFVNSHKLGDKAHIDLVLSFATDAQYKDMIALKNNLQEELSGVIKDCTVNITIV